MTTSTWDEGEIERQFGDCSNLREIIDRVEREFSDRGEVICEIRVNGTVLDESAEAAAERNLRTDVRTLAIASEQPEALIRDALGSALDYLARVRDACVSTADLFRGPDVATATQRFAQTVEGCQWLVDTIRSLRGAVEGTGQSLSNQAGWMQAESELMVAVGDVVDAFGKKDVSLLADLLEYELNNALDLWREVLSAELSVRAVAVSSPR